MKNKEGDGRRNKKEIVIKGKIWWGNGYFLKEKIEEKGEKEEQVKENFIIKNFPEIENFILFLNKYTPIIEAKVIDEKKNKIETWFDIQSECIGGESKKFFLNELKNRFKNKNKYYEKISEFQNIIQTQKSSLEKQGYKSVYSSTVKTRSRLIVGLGSSHVLETSITLHHIYGIPYIPSSALKGVCRMVAFWRIAENKKVINNENELSKIQNEFYGELSSDEEILKYQLLFGAQNFKGLLLFLDAHPIIENNREIFDLDIMNVHYQKYYSDTTGKIPPGDWENPNPIIFLTLKEGIKFNFNVLYDKWRATRIKESEEKELKELKIPEYAKEIVNNWESNTQELENEIKKLIEEALKEFGVGAKTRLGYGIFEYV